MRRHLPIVAYLILVAAIIAAFVRVEDVRRDQARIVNRATVASCELRDRVLNELVSSLANPNVDPNAPDLRYQSASRKALQALRETDCKELGAEAARASE